MRHSRASQGHSSRMTNGRLRVLRAFLLHLRGAARFDARFFECFGFTLCGDRTKSHVVSLSLSSFQAGTDSAHLPFSIQSILCHVGLLIFKQALVFRKHNFFSPEQRSCRSKRYRWPCIRRSTQLWHRKRNLPAPATSKRFCGILGALRAISFFGILITLTLHEVFQALFCFARLLWGVIRKILAFVQTPRGTHAHVNCSGDIRIDTFAGGVGGGFDLCLAAFLDLNFYTL